MATQKIKLLCDSEILEIEEEVAIQSLVLRNMIEDTGLEGEIPIPNTRIQILKKALEYCSYYKGKEIPKIKKPLPSANLSEFLEEWDFKFIDIEKVEDLIDLIVCANFLDIEGLLDLGCAKIASMIKGRTVEEIREIFGIENDFTKEEEAQLREENKWAEDLIS